MDNGESGVYPDHEQSEQSDVVGVPKLNTQTVVVTDPPTESD